LLEDEEGLKEIRDLLKGVYDLERIIGRINSGMANARDLVALSTSLRMVPFLRQKGFTLDGSFAPISVSIYDVSKNYLGSILAARNPGPGATPIDCDVAGALHRGIDVDRVLMIRGDQPVFEGVISEFYQERKTPFPTQ